MASVFDQIHSQQAPPPTGNIFDQIHADQKPSDQGRSVGGFISNAINSTGSLVGGITSAVTHLPQTLGAITDLGAGMFEKAANAGSSATGPHEKAVDALVDQYKARFGSWENIKKTLYEDPAGAAADLATFAGGAGAIAKGAARLAAVSGAADTANALRTASSAAATVSDVANPLNAIAKGAGKIVDVTATPVANAGRGAMDAFGRRIYQAALKPAKTNTIEDIEKMVDFGRKEGLVPGSKESLTRTQAILDDMRQQISDGLAAHQGDTVSPQSVANRVEDARPMFRGVNEAGDMRDLDRVKSEFLQQNTPPATPAPAPSNLTDQYGRPTQANAPPPPTPQPIPIADAQSLKTTQAGLLNRADYYGKLSTATIEGQKALVRGLKEDIQSLFPEIEGLNERQGTAMSIQPELEAAFKRIQSRDMVPIGDSKIVVLKKLLDNPKLKAKLSIMLQNAPGLPSLPDGTRTIGSRIALVNSRFGNYLDGIAEADKQSAQNP